MDALMPNTMMNGIAITPGMIQGMSPQVTDTMNKVTKDATKTLSGLISQHVAEGYQQLTQAGVPVADAANHILSELLKLSPTGAMKTGQAMTQQDTPMPPTGVNGGVAMMGGGGSPQPPGGNGGQQPGGGGQPPNGTPVASNNNQQDSSQAVAPGVSAGSVPPPGNPAGQVSPVTAQSIAGQFILPEQQGGLLAQNRIGKNGQFIAGGPFGAMFGIAPEAYQTMMAGNAMNPANKVMESVSEAQNKPMTAAELAQQGIEERKLKAGGFEAQAKMLNDQQQQIAEQLTKAKSEFDVSMGARGLNRFSPWGSPTEANAYNAKVGALMIQYKNNSDKIHALYGTQPNLPLSSKQNPPSVPKFNPKTQRVLQNTETGEYKVVGR